MPAILLKPINILFPEHWADDKIRNAVDRIDSAGYTLTYSIGKVEEPCIDADDDMRVNAILAM